jgi:hypothetical protein
VGESCAVTAEISHTFLDGSLVPLRVDGRIGGIQRAWARNGRKQTLIFPVAFDRPGKHVVVVAGRELELIVQP